MAVLLANFSGVLSDALTIGAIIGAVVGVVVFTASSAGEGMQRVVFGFIVGGIVMGVMQALIIGQAAGVGMGGSFNPLLQSRVGSFGDIVYRGIVLTIQAALAGGLLMIISLAPFRAVKGALLGTIIGSAAAFAAWWVLQTVGAAVPLVLFYVLILGLVVFVIEMIPTRAVR